MLMAILSSLSSCEKEYSIENGGILTTDSSIHSNTLKDSVFIDFIIRTQLINGNFDTLAITQFSYDNQNRLKGWKDYPRRNEGIVESMTFEYRGTDTLPYYARYQKRDITSPDSLIQHYYFFYNALGKKTVDSVIKVETNGPADAGFVDKFYYSPGKVVKIGQYKEPGRVYNYRDTGLINGVGDFVEHRFYDDDPVSGLTQTMHNYFSYDNRNHIFSHCNIRNAVPQSDGGGAFYKYAATNNIIRQDINLPAINWTEITENEITYNKFDFPLVAHTKVKSSEFKLYFFYRSLN